MTGSDSETPGPPGTVLEEGEALPQSPGGGALLRLIEKLQSDGYSELAEQTVELAVAEDDARTVMEIVAATGVSPPDAPKGRRRATRSRPRRGETAATGVNPDGLGVAEEIAEAYLAAAEVMGPPTPFGPQWRSCGPWTIVNGQTYGATRTNVSGRVSALAVDPANPAHVLAGAANGGVWESFNRGASWAPRTDYQRTLAVGALAFDPSAPRTVYCGLGEGDWWSWLGVGVLRSTDGGTTWATLCTAPFVGDGFHTLVVDPSNRMRLFAGTRGGLWVSTDGGLNWTRRRTQTTWSIARRGNQVLAACADGLFRSTNGNAWTAVALPGAPGTFQRLAVAIAPSNATIAYAWGSSGATGFLWRRAGGTWTAIGLPLGPPSTRRGTTGSSRSRPTRRTRSTAERSTSTAAPWREAAGRG